MDDKSKKRGDDVREILDEAKRIRDDPDSLERRRELFDRFMGIIAEEAKERADKARKYDAKSNVVIDPEDVEEKEPSKEIDFMMAVPVEETQDEAEELGPEQRAGKIKELAESKTPKRSPTVASQPQVEDKEDPKGIERKRKLQQLILRSESDKRENAHKGSIPDQKELPETEEDDSDEKKKSPRKEEDGEPQERLRKHPWDELRDNHPLEYMIAARKKLGLKESKFLKFAKDAKSFLAPEESQKADESTGFLGQGQKQQQGNAPDFDDLQESIDKLREVLEKIYNKTGTPGTPTEKREPAMKRAAPAPTKKRDPGMMDFLNVAAKAFEMMA